MSDAALLLGGYGTDRRRLHPLRDALGSRGVTAEVWPYRPVGSIAALAEHHVGPRWPLVSAVGDLAVPASSALRVGARGDRLRRRTVRANGHSVSLLSPRLIATVTEHASGADQLDATG